MMTAERIAAEVSGVTVEQATFLLQWLETSKEGREVTAMYDALDAERDARLVRESRRLLHRLENVEGRQGCRYSKALNMAQNRHERRLRTQRRGR